MPRSGRDSEPHRQFIAGKNRLVPAQLVAAGRAEIRNLRQIDFGVDTHHQRRGMPAAGDHAAVNTIFRGFFIDVIRERHIALAEFDYFFFVDRDGTEFVNGAGHVVFEVTVVRR